MRSTVVLLVLASLSACNPPTESSAATEVPIAATPAALTFDGAGASEPASQVAHGKRLSHILGCTGCHRANLEGTLFNKDAPEMGKIYASNLTQAIPAMSDQQLEKLLREGVHPTRGDMWIMPSEVFQHLSAADMAALIAHLRTVKPSGDPTPPPELSAKGRAEVASGKMRPTAKWVAQYRTELPADLGDQHRWGQHLASITCAECHGGNLEGIADFGPGISTPNLDIAGVYNHAELTRLLTTGEGKTRKDLGLMTLVGKEHFSYLTPRERSAIIAYLKARAERPQ